MAAPGLPKPTKTIIEKLALLNDLKVIDEDSAARKRVLEMENVFRAKIKTHVESLPTQNAKFARFNTSPFVLMFYAFQHSYHSIHQIEQAILPAKVFSSMETSAGRMVETVVLPVYSWEIVPSEMHSVNSHLDGKKLDGSVLNLATLKSGPRCLNDEMSENFADAILGNCEQWAAEHGVSRINFTYGVLYGTRKQSNKKDWHILRNIREKISNGIMVRQPDNHWDCEFKIGDLSVSVTIRIGFELWNYIAERNTAFIELCTALIRACVKPIEAESEDFSFTISDLDSIISMEKVPDEFNVSILQRSQFEWLFFLARHFCDEII